MHIEKRPRGDLLEFAVAGLLDHDSSIHFRDEIESSARDGWHRIVVDLSGVTYLSSAGIAALVTAKQRLDALNGLFGVHSATPEVEQVLNLTRLLDVLRCDPRHLRGDAPSGKLTLALESTTRFANVDGLELEIYSLRDPKPLQCQVIGAPDWLFEAQTASPKPQRVSFGPHAFGLGLGALGNDTESSSTRFGEFLAAAGAVAQSAPTSGGLPDYLLAAGDFVPAAQVLYGIKCEGEFPILIRFNSSEADGQIGLSKLIEHCLKQAGCQTAGFIILADCAGLLGAETRRVSLETSPTAIDRFALPGIRSWLSFSAEQIHRRHLVLIVGVATTDPVEKSSPLRGMLRPLDAGENLSGHFHAAVFPYRPLKKRTLPLESSVTTLFESDAIQDVLHLLRDDRPMTEFSESELFSGACWLGPIADVLPAEVAR